MARTIDVVSLYPKDMNIYGDTGNVLDHPHAACDLYGYEPQSSHLVQPGRRRGPTSAGPCAGRRRPGHRPEERSSTDLSTHRADLLRSLVPQARTPMLMICGLYQLFGEYFETVDGTRLDGIGAIGAYTVGQRRACASAI